MSTEPPRKLRREMAVLLLLMPSLTVTAMTRSVEFGNASALAYCREAMTAW